jgi:hypothetical protein
VFVPPWNRMAPALMDVLAELGYRGLSMYTARPRREAAPGVAWVNTHADIIAWRGGGRFAGEDAVIGGIVDHLSRRRGGRADGDEPTGLLTHHLAHDAECEAFLAELLAAVGAHPAARWLAAADAFGLAPG